MATYKVALPIPSGEVLSCNECAALIAADDQDTHDEWHDTLQAHTHHVTRDDTAYVYEVGMSTIK